MDNIRRKIIIVDDNITNLTIGRNLLKERYEVYLATSARQMFEMLTKIRPDLILLDIDMPYMNGYEAIAILKGDECLDHIPVMFLTAQTDQDSELKGFDLGCADYINKPFSPPLLLKRIEHQLLITRQQEIIRQHVDNLSVMVSEKISEVTNLQNALIGTVADLVECRDKFTGGHVSRTKLYLKALVDGLSCNKLYSDKTSGWNMDYILQSAQLHDVGKIAVPDAILNKTSQLTPEEYDIMKTHVTVGVDAVKRIICNNVSHEFLCHALNIIGYHHEKWDGTGYPYGLKGEDIPLEGRLMAMADVYDALISWRPYKKEFTHEQARQLIAQGRGTHFDPVVVDVFLAVEQAFRQIAVKSTQNDIWQWNALILTKDMQVGVPKIDEQHAELINRLNQTLNAGTTLESREDTQKMLDFLCEYVLFHFSDEEELQQQSDYPKYEWHKSQHQSFVGEYLKLQKDFYDNGFSAQFLLKLHNFVINWIINHIKSVDVEFGKYYQIRNVSCKAP